MQFLVLARDGTDPDASTRRQKYREAHLANMTRLKAAGNYLIGGAILDDKGAMIGSAVIFEFPDRAALDETLANDPYMQGKVWQHVEVQPYRKAPV
ncbi:MAG TPA: YciI family protein [Alphaproteobacteria bacterium]|nr:YciI family protein [Alphaproteobacteria bacterium]